MTFTWNANNELLGTDYAVKLLGSDRYLVTQRDVYVGESPTLVGARALAEYFWNQEQARVAFVESLA